MISGVDQAYLGPDELLVAIGRVKSQVDLTYGYAIIFIEFESIPPRKRDLLKKSTQLSLRILALSGVKQSGCIQRNEFQIASSPFGILAMTYFKGFSTSPKAGVGHLLFGL